MNDSKTVFITGATAGIGRETARTLSANGFRLIICGRRRERLEELKRELPSEAITLRFDVRDRTAVNREINSLPNEWKSVDILINNAGNAHGLDTIDEGNPDDWDAMIDINVKGLLYVSKAVLPLMKGAAEPHIINVGSTAGKEVYPRGNVYCASKHAVDAISQGMRLDLLFQGVKVSQICPGLVNTEFSMVRFKGDRERAETVYENMKPLLAEDIAHILLFMINCPHHVNIADLVVMPLDQASSTQVRRES